MPDTRISGLTTDATRHGNDLLVVVDTTDTTMAASGTTKKLQPYAFFGSPTSGNVIYWSGSSTTGAPAAATSLSIGSSGQLNQAAITAPGSPANGDSWMDSAQLCEVSFPNGIKSFWTGVLFAQTTPVVITATGNSSLISTTGALGSLNLPAGFLNVLGKSLRCRAWGYGSVGVASTTGYFAKLGANVVATTQLATNLTSVANKPWSVDFTMTCVGTGASGKLTTGGPVISLLFNAPTTLFCNGTTAGTQTPQTVVTIDLTQAYTFDFQTAQNTTTNTTAQTGLILEALN